MRSGRANNCPLHSCSPRVLPRRQRRRMQPQSLLAGPCFADFCTACHGDDAIAGGGMPDLRHMDAHNSLEAIVRGGLRHEKGMAGFGEVLSQEQLASAIVEKDVSRQRAD